MTTTMTWTDGALALILGVIGSIIASHLYGKLPALSNIFSQWLSRRSQRATAARLQRLRLQLDEVKSFKEDTGKYVGCMLRLLGHAQMRDFFAILFIVGATGALVTAIIKNDGDLAIVANVGLGSSLAVAFLANIKRTRLWDLSDLERREVELKREIESLEAACRP
jgi:hypothetical protein